MPESAAGMASPCGIIPTQFQRALRREQFPWHEKYARRNAPEGTPVREEMIRALKRLIRQLRGRGS